MSISNNVDPQNPGETSSNLAVSMSTELRNLSPRPAEYSIYRVPESLQQENKKAYNPQLISIGPFHHEKSGLLAMEEDKLIYLQGFLDRTDESVHTFVDFVREREMKIRSYYSETFSNFANDKFVRMIVLDLAFVVELLCRNFCRKEIHKSDRIFHKPQKLDAIRHDMMLLENQLPFFLLEEIFPKTKLTVPPCTAKVALLKIVYKFFHAKAYLGDEGKVLEKTRDDSDIKHFVDFFRKCHVPEKQPSDRVIETLNLPSVTELYHAGVKFKGSSRSLLDVKFSQGTLEIPHLRIRKSTESFLLNMLAYEQCHLLDYYINDYLFMLDKLIVNTRDVFLLAQSGAFESKLPDDEEVVKLVNNLVRGSILRHKHFNFKELCDGLNAHHGNPWNTWMATLKHVHFSSPLTIFAVMVATAVFVLTLIQTVCSCGLQFKNSK